MKASLLCSATLFSLATFAFPANLLSNDISDDTLADIAVLAAKIKRAAEERPDASNVKRGFNADAQRISTSGDHQYIAPGPNDLRGPCPGLNAMANHGYISRSGVSSIVELTTASNEVFGMGLDLSGFLSVYAAVMDGDVASVSIGGAPKSGLLGGVTSSIGLLGKPQGLAGSHNRFECDASPTRSDEYVTGDPASVNLSQFEELVAMPLGPNGIDLSVIFPFRVERTKQSIATNGHFFAGPLTHLAVNSAAFYFTYRFFANHSAEYPEGYLDVNTLKSFEGITGEQGNYKWASGQERIPENWYRRAIGDDYGILGLDLDAVDAITKYPELVRVGGNTGQPNTFVGVDVDDLTGNVFNAQTLLEGNNAMCLAFTAAQVASPDILRGLLGNIVKAVQHLTDALNPILQTLGCPELVKYDATLFDRFPGAGSGL
ncbi:unnamed protein product [Alternaria alternata]|uniref:Heme haloperoxidase family profile domain-containing protein n=1 Tax=Alternaria tenuissima TaxID=119927 RepID=A0ABY0GQL7_9PLEO|nr:hypothetical protein AA0119_g1412 [Alternaria tenuissima]RYO22036.1 hypothetical protein AA0121_g2308 [Alternaria tenuissima]